MSFFKLTLAYDGAEFSGWQGQPGRRTVQGELERAWQEITGEAVRVNAAGRTDAGVHAAGQVVGVESSTLLRAESLLGALNAKLPADVAVIAVELAPEGFHATHDANRKRYQYTIYNDRRRPVFLRRYAWHVPSPLDAEAMHRAAQSLVGTHDFACFQSVGSERESTVRTIFAVDVNANRAGEEGPIAAPGSVGLSSESSSLESDSLVTIEVEGDGFLYNMVRAIAGTLVEVGRGKRDEHSLTDVLASLDRCRAGQTAPAHGLTMLWVQY